VTHQTLKFANGETVGCRGSLPSKIRKVHAARLHFLLWQYYHTARFHQFASFLVNIKINVFIVQLSAAACRMSADNLPFFRPHILTVSPSLLLEFSWANGRRCGLRTFTIETDSDGPAIASNRAQRASIGWDRRRDTDDILVMIHHDEAHVTNQNTN
jgi:hypothetical protein